ncbi:MAG: endo-1,4-beta-xylanase [Lachnospiraceae bacterium]|nr:endo-1,4-beta-xylanase [Lachnospiraceae bacterium]
MKLLSEEQYTTDKWNSQIAAVYGATEVASDGVTEPKYLMIGLTDTATVTIGSITFALGETSIDDGGEGEGGEANDSEVTTTFEGWTEDSTSGDITADVDSASGAITFAGTGTYKQMFYAIPEDVDTTRLEKVVLNDVTGDADKIFMKLLSEEQYTTDKWNSQIAAVYGATEVASDGVTEPKYLMIGLTDTATVTIGSITFVLGETAIGGGGSGESTTVELTFNDIPIVANWDSTSEVDNTTGKITISNAVQYAQTFFEIPADIDVTRLDSVIVNGITGSYGLKLMTQAEYDEGKGNAAIVAYGNPTLSTAGATNIKYVVVMGMEPGTVTADSVTFKLRAAGETAPTTSTVEYHFGDITVASGYGHNRNVDEYNRLNLTFTQQYGEVKFAIPAELKDQIITGIKVTPVSGNTSTLAIKVYDTEAGMNSGNQMHVSWGGMNFSINPSKLVGVGFMATDSNDAVASNPLLIKKITFTVQGDFEGGSDFLSEVSYNFNDLTAAGGWNQVSSVTAKDGKLTMNFAEKYGEVQFAIPDEMLGKNITKMSFSTSVGNAADLAVKLYAGDTAVVTKYGETSFDISTEEDITKFAFMLNSDDVSPIVIDKVTFVVEADVENGSEFITEAYTTVPAAALEPVISGNAEVLDAEVNGGKLGINFNEEGAAVFFKIPSYVDMSKVKYVDLEDVASALSLVDTTYGTALNGVKLNAYTAADFATKTPTLTSDTSAVVTDGNANIKYIGLVSTAATASVSMTRVGFVEKNITKNGDMFSWTADNFVFDGTNSTASATAVDDNKWLCTFEEADDIAIFELPETFITGNAKDFAIAISKRDVPVVLSFLDAEMNEVWSTKNPERVQSYHNVDTVASRVDVKAKYLAISVKEGGAKMCVLDGISANKRVFSNEPYVVPTYTILTYTAADVLKMENDGWSGSTFEKLGETVKVNLPGTYGEISFKLPVKIDLAQCESVNIKLKNQNLPIAVKLMKNYDAVVVNYDRVLGERNFAPFSDAQINKFSLMSLESAPHSSAEFESITFTIKGDYVPEAISTGGIIVNGNFDDPDVSDWKAAFWDDVTITTEVSAKPIFGNVNTYGVYSKRTSPYQCFAQDITGRVVQDGTYTFSFWAKLSDDYKGAPDNQRVVQFSPYTVDVNGVPDYNPNLQGVYAQSLKVGEWTKYEGIWKITNANKIESVFVRILEQGTNYGQGDCVLGSYAITGVEIKEYIPDPPSIDEDVPDLKAALTQEFGDGFIVGTCISGNEFDDIGVEMLANKHFNAITLGNELKPDAMMGYSEKHTALQTITFNGQKLVVPTLTFASADTKLNQIIKWNKKHPESPIKVRGHVLVWHSQTMEWFFRENYEIGQNADGSENYVTPEEMNLRLEWYIKSVLEHYTGEDSPYKDLFYGWDVVNEAVSDGTGTYRTDTVTKSEKPSDTRHGSNSSWWAVYKSNEFVIKAFQFANKYAPAELELYYNDYNETDTRKVKGIVQLLKDVLAAEGTRIDAMGMQAHYNLYNPGMGSLEQAIRQYCAVVGKVQLTELDLKATDYIGSDTALAREYASQALHYKKIHDLLLRLDAQDGIDIAGVTFWGTIDTYSWLQEGSNVGGGSDGTAQHCPLLFDGNYKVKPAYWAWVDYSMVDPDYVADNTSGGSSTEKPEKDTDDKDETESTESVEQTESLTVPVIKDEEEKSSVAGPIAAVAGVVVVGAGLGAFFWNKKRKSIGE